MMNLPTQQGMFLKALENIDMSRSSLSDARDWLRSDWEPVGLPLPQGAAEARIATLEKIVEAKAAIDEAKAELYRALGVYRE